jgi:hypothetical protein
MERDSRRARLIRSAQEFAAAAAFARPLAFGAAVLVLAMCLNA